MKTPRVFIAVFIFILFAGGFALVKADSANINFDVEGPSGSIYNQSITVPDCVTPNNASSTVNGFCAFGASGLPVDVTWSSFGGLVNSINNVAGDSSNYWLWFLNGNAAQVGMDSYILQSGDTVLWALGRQPLKVSLSTASPKVNAPATVTVLGFNTTNFDFEPVAGATITGTSLITDANGKADIIATSTTPFSISVSATGYIPGGQFTITPQPESVNVIIRDGGITAFSGSVPLPDSGAPSINILPTNSTSTVAVSPRSVLGVLYTLDQTSSAFDITNLSYFSSFNSFLINCIAVPASTSTPDCYNWTDAINGSYPQVGIDQQTLHDGDTVYLFFGQPHQTVLSKSSVAVGESFTASAQQYDLPSGTYKPLTGVTLGVGTKNPDFSFTEVATSTVNTSGQAMFSLNATGTLAVGIKEDFYFPTATLTVTDATSTPPSGGTSGGGGITHSNLNIASALTFISNNQNADGSFDSAYSTDWTALAFASADPGSSKAKLANYLLNSKPTLSSITDFERHAMALEALNINPYSGTQTDCISPIVKSFDGTQIGDSSLDNDDIFAVFALSKAGYGPTDPIIKQEIKYIISTQKADGSWDESPDMTAAAIQAIGPYYMTPGYVNATGMAIGYLSSKQNADGGWGSIDSTSWVTSMLNAVREGDPAHFVPLVSSSGYFSTDALGKAQASDGGVPSSNRVWSTSYAVIAASGTDWLDLLHSFPKPTTPNTGSVQSSPVVKATSTPVAVPIISATSTPEIATTTKLVVILKPSDKDQVATSKISVLAKFNTKKNVVKVILTQHQPAVLGESTTQQPVIPEHQNKQPDSQDSAKPGFFGRVWHSIASFFENLF